MEGTATGEKLFYTDKTQEVEFIGPVHARDKDGQVLDTPTGLTLSLKKDGKSRIPGKFTGTLFVQDDQEETATPSAGSTTPSTGKSDKAENPPPAAPDKQEPSDKKSP